MEYCHNYGKSNHMELVLRKREAFRVDVVGVGIV